MTQKQVIAIEHLVAKGISFNKDVFQLNGLEKSIILDEAKAYKYKPKENGSCVSSCVSSRFYLFLQRIYPKYRKTYYPNF